MSLYMNNAGGAWDNAKKLVETGAYGTPNWTSHTHTYAHTHTHTHPHTYAHTHTHDLHATYGSLTNQVARIQKRIKRW
jgi:Na+/H+-translocating membrane pyrophosphatase